MKTRHGSQYYKMLLGIKTVLEDHNIDLTNSLLNDQNWISQKTITLELILQELEQLENLHSNESYKKAAIHNEFIAVQMRTPIPLSPLSAGIYPNGDTTSLGATTDRDRDYVELDYYSDFN